MAVASAAHHIELSLDCGTGLPQSKWPYCIYVCDADGKDVELLEIVPAAYSDAVASARAWARQCGLPLLYRKQDGESWELRV